MMSTIQFTTRIGPDGAIHLPAGTTLPQGEIEVSIRPKGDANANLENLSRQIAVRLGLDWDTLRGGCACHPPGRRGPRDSWHAPSVAGTWRVEGVDPVYGAGFRRAA